MAETNNQNTMGVFAYFLGFITGILLLMTEKKNKFIRFHAMQSTIVFGGLTVAMFIPVIGQSIIPLITLALWIFLMYKAYSGEMFKLPTVGDFAEEQLKKMDEQANTTNKQTEPKTDDQPKQE